MPAPTRVCAIGFLFLACVVTATQSNAAGKVTPVEKVMELMKKLSAQITAEGKKEAEQYDKYACFCKEQADEKLYQIEKSEKLIAKLTATINKLASEITALNADINALTLQIEAKEGEIKSAEELRATQHADYVAKDDSMVAAIAAIKGAIKALKNSKSQLKGDTDLDLVQLRTIVAAASPGAAAALAQVQKPGEAHAYEYQSNDIIAVLQGLLKDFNENKKELDTEEFDTNSAFEKERLGLQNEIKFADKDRTEKEQIMEKKNEQHAAADEDKTAETNAMNADQNFLDQLTTECQTKAGDWDQRSKTRADELTALQGALETLESGVADQYSANKKLVDLQREKAATSFLQIRGTGTEALKVAATHKVSKILSIAAAKLNSPVLSMMSMKVKLAADHFVKVRGLIKDLIQRLQDDAESEATQKGFCDTNMAAALAERDTANAELEEAAALISKLTAESNQLKEEISNLEAAIAQNLKALNEATELRNAEKSENGATVETATEGETSVELALSILNQFYNNAFVQLAKYVPPNSDRSGKTVADRAPEVFSGTYHGSQTASKGIVGLLEVILTDFQRTITKTTEDETTAQEAFELFETDINNDNIAKNADIDTKDTRISVIKDDLITAEEDQINSKKLKANALEELRKLKPMCVEGEETYAERVAKRQKEIAALRDAMVILDEWQK